MNFTPSGRFGKLQTVKHLTIFLAACLPFLLLGEAASRRFTPPTPLGEAASRRFTSSPFAKLGPAANLPYPDGHVLALQICLDRRGFSANALDGRCGRKTDVALATYCAVRQIPCPDRGWQAKAWETLFPGETNLFTTVIVTPEDRRAIVRIPRAPAEKAKLPKLGYQSLLEMYAERGHLAEATLRALNPGVRWPNPPIGTVIQIPYFPPPPPKPRVLADVLRVSLARREITAFDAQGRMLALFPCSIAAKNDKRPPTGEVQVISLVPDPVYPYTSDTGSKYIYQPGPNNPVGLAWIGLSFPKDYGIHGTPWPEQIGRAESHGCFRLSNWNAVRLRELCNIGTSVVIE